MLKLSEPRVCSVKDYDALKELYEICFEDKKEVVDSFFEKTLKSEIAVGIFQGDKAVSSLYLLKSEIQFPDGEKYPAFYVYAVSTHPDYRGNGLMKKLLNFGEGIAEKNGACYLFLVPAEESLFPLYEKCGYKTGFFYEEKELLNADFPKSADCCEKTISFDDYRKYIKCNVPTAVLCEGAFKSFFGFKGGEAGLVYVENKGFCVYEKNEGQVIVFELRGDENAVLGCLFSSCSEEKIKVFSPCCDGSPKPYGMFLKLRECRDIENGFFGVPYST